MHLREKKFFKKRIRRDKRLTTLTVVIFLFAFFILVRYFNLQILEYRIYAALASGQHEIYEKLFPARGEIFLQEKLEASALNEESLYPLAINREYTLIYADPRQVEDPLAVAQALAPLLELKEEEIFNKVSKNNDPYEPLKHKITDEIVDQIKDLALAGIYFIPEIFRYWPEKNIGSQVAGFVGMVGEEQRGQYGLEGYFEEDLKGEPGFIRSQRDAYGRLITLGDKEFIEARDGVDLILTIDHVIQYKACDELNQAVLRHGADGGSIIIMDPASGSILAMCGTPDYDPNNYALVEDINVYNNPAIFTAYEPGSIFKAITMAAALDSGKVEPNTTYVDEGKVQIAGYTIKNSDYKVYGESTMIEILTNSINTGAIFAAQQVGNELFYEYVRNFGFGELTNIRLDTEVPGDISSLSKGQDIYVATASFGQGITVTPLQMITAYAAIANGGKLVKPYIVQEMVYEDGQRLAAKPQEIRQVISQRTANLLAGMLVEVVENGHAIRAQVPGYYLAGKTGTAQVPDSEKRGYSDRTTHTFVGFGPVDEPAFVMLIKMDDPKDVRFAAGSSAPLFGKLAQFVLNYLEIPPDYQD